MRPGSLVYHDVAGSLLNSVPVAPPAGHSEVHHCFKRIVDCLPALLAWRGRASASQRLLSVQTRPKKLDARLSSADLRLTVSAAHDQLHTSCLRTFFRSRQRCRRLFWYLRRACRRSPSTGCGSLSKLLGAVVLASPLFESRGGRCVESASVMGRSQVFQRASSFAAEVHILMTGCSRRAILCEMFSASAMHA